MLVRALCRNTQCSVRVNTSLLRLQTETLLRALLDRTSRIKPTATPTTVSVGVRCCTNREIHSLNATYRGVDAPTDVLSFPAEQVGNGGQLIADMVTEGERDLGDLVIAMPYSQKLWPDRPASQWLPVLVAHGLCHLVGYTHDCSGTATEMYQLEKAILSKLQSELRQEMVESPLTQNYFS